MRKRKPSGMVRVTGELDYHLAQLKDQGLPAIAGDCGALFRTRGPQACLLQTVTLFGWSLCSEKTELG